ncbi:MAG: hypothetical protein N3A57_00340 [Negativicutes bacterium]|nr:hypothetical protein [Negativicutes bacterium]
MKKILAFCLTLAVWALPAGPAAAFTALGTPQKSDYAGWPELPMSGRDSGGQLMLADSPEYVERFGVTFAAETSGEGRLFVHQVNNTGQPMRIAILLTNDGNAPVRVERRTACWAGPGLDYLALGRKVMLDWLSRQSGQIRERPLVIAVPAGATVELDSELSRQLFTENHQLITGIWDWRAGGRLTVRVLALPAGRSPLDSWQSAEQLPPDGIHPYGTYPAALRVLTADRPFDSDGGPVRISLGDNQYDRWLQGRAGGQAVENQGNYGLLYRLTIPSKGRRPFDIYLAATGGVHAGAVWLFSPAVGNNPIQTPYFGMWYGAEVAGLARVWYIGSADGGTTVQMLWSPPGSSNLPVRLLLVPR